MKYKWMIAVLAGVLALPASAQLVRLGGNGNAGGQTGVNIGQATRQVDGAVNTDLGAAANVDGRGGLNEVGQATDSAQQTAGATAKKTKKAAKHAQDATASAAQETKASAKDNVKAAKDSAENTNVSAGTSSEATAGVGKTSSSADQNVNVNANKSGVDASAGAAATADHPQKN